MTKPIKKLLAPKTLLLIGVGYTILITIAFLFPKVTLPNTENVSIDKWIHFFIHLILILLWLSVYFSFYKHKNVLRSVGLVFVLCLGYGIIIEVLQEVLTQNRTADYYDILANVGGSILGTLFFIKTR
ncbi:VanZ family protein [Jejudonia soesokkakensis]|uniref:VanZ family protein n=1 Tax=Jejudonia soesokkakensis TaxID=1323432 RepID=A0ABW2MW77_9FLAO